MANAPPCLEPPSREIRRWLLENSQKPKTINEGAKAKRRRANESFFLVAFINVSFVKFPREPLTVFPFFITLARNSIAIGTTHDGKSLFVKFARAVTVGALRQRRALSPLRRYLKLSSPPPRFASSRTRSRVGKLLGECLKRKISAQTVYIHTHTHTFIYTYVC